VRCPIKLTLPPGNKHLTAWTSFESVNGWTPGTTIPASLPTPPITNAFTTQALSVPLFEVPSLLPGQDNQPQMHQQLYTPPQTTTADGSQGFESESPASSNHSHHDVTNGAMSTPATPASYQIPAVQVVSSCTVPEMQLRRSYEKLQVRNAEAEAENGKLRQVIRENESELGRVDALLKDLLSEGGSGPGQVHEKLAQVSEILTVVRARSG
jgi:hypothetical protein